MLNTSDENVGVIYNKMEYAGFMKRVAITVVDIIVIIVFSLLCLWITDYLIPNEDTYFTVNFILILISAILYLALIKRSKYGTLGYVLTGVKIVNLKGEKPSVFKMILRVLLLLIGPFEIFIDIIWLTSEVTKQSLRDKYIGTYVISKRAKPIGHSRLQNVSLGIMGWNLMYREVKESCIK